MAQRTYDTTPLRETALSAAVAAANVAIDDRNAVLAAQTPPGTPLPVWTNESFWRARNDDLHDYYVAWNQQGIAATCVAAFAKADPLAQQQVLAMLGMTAYASLPAAELASVLATVGMANFVKLSATDKNAVITMVGLGV